MRVGHGRALQTQGLGHPMAEPPGSPPGAGDPLQGPRSALFDDTLRRFDMFGGSNELRILRNKDRCVRIEDSFATVRESCRSDFGASRKAPKTKGRTAKSSNRRHQTEPRAPQQGSSAMELGHSRAPQAQCLGHWLAEPPGAPPRAGDPLKGPPTALFDDTPRRFAMFASPNDLRLLRNKDHCVRIEDIFATVRESCLYDFGAS